DVLVDHRITLHTQRIDPFRSHPSKEEARHTDHFDVFNGVNRNASGDTTDQRYFAHGIRGRVLVFDGEGEAAGLMFALNQTALFKRRDVFGYRRLRADSEVTSNLCVRGFVTVLRSEANDVIEDFFLTLSARQHVSQSKSSNSKRAIRTRQAFQSPQ